MLVTFGLLILLWYVELFIQSLGHFPPLCGYYKYAFTLVLNSVAIRC